MNEWRGATFNDFADPEARGKGHLVTASGVQPITAWFVRGPAAFGRPVTIHLTTGGPLTALELEAPVDLDLFMADGKRIFCDSVWLRATLALGPAYDAEADVRVSRARVQDQDSTPTPPSSAT